MKFNTAMLRPLRAIAGVHRPPDEGQQPVLNSVVLSRLRQPPPECALAHVRLSMASRVTASAPEYVPGLVQGPGGEVWRQAPIASMRLLVILVRPK